MPLLNSLNSQMRLVFDSINITQSSYASEIVMTMEVGTLQFI